MSITLKMKCKKHPKYKAIRPSNCPACQFLYELRPLGEGEHRHKVGPTTVVTKYVNVGNAW